MFKVHRTYDLTTGVKNKSIAVFNDGNTVKILYHKTIVVQGSYGSLILNTGGWNTVSTRTVINRALSLLSISNGRLFTKKGELFIEYNGVVRPFKDGMELRSNIVAVNVTPIRQVGN